MFNSDVKINENMLVKETYDLEGDTGDWGYFCDPSDPKRQSKQPKRTTKYSNCLKPIPEDIYYHEEGDYEINNIPKISTMGLLLNTIYLIQYILCKVVPNKFWGD